MPTSEPNPGAPENYWIGQYDAQAMVDSIGMSWLQPVMGLVSLRMINVPELCALPPPNAPAITLSDIIQGSNPLASEEAKAPFRQKLYDWVDNYTWSVYCHYTDATPAPLPPYQDPPTGMPDTNPAAGPNYDRMIYDIVAWIQRQFNPLSFTQETIATVSGVGTVYFESRYNSQYYVWPMGVITTVTEKPDYSGRSGGGEPAVMYDLGWLSVGNNSQWEPPVRLARDVELIHSRIRVTAFAYNLAPGVTIQIEAMYPQLEAIEG